RLGIAMRRPSQSGGGRAACAAAAAATRCRRSAGKGAPPPAPRTTRGEKQFLRAPRGPPPRGRNTGGPGGGVLLGPAEWVCGPYPGPDQELAFVAIVGLGDKGAELGRAAIIEAEPQFIKQDVGRLVEQHGIIGEVHMPVVVDPFGQYLALETLVRGRKTHRAGL